MREPQAAPVMGDLDTSCLSLKKGRRGAEPRFCFYLFSLCLWDLWANVLSNLEIRVQSFQKRWHAASAGPIGRAPWFPKQRLRLAGSSVLGLE